MSARYATLLAAALLIIPLGVTAERTVDIGESTTFTMSVTNPLDIPDIVTIRVDGAATRDGMVTVTPPANTTDTTCYDRGPRCRVYLEPHGTRSLPLTVTVHQGGTQPVTVTATSTTTEKRSENSVTINTLDRGFLAGIMSWLTGFLG